MYARRVVPFLLMAGAVMMIMQRKQHEFMGRCEEGEPRGPLGLHGDLHRDWRGEWGKRVPPLFEMWHKRAHEQEAQSATTTPAI